MERPHHLRLLHYRDERVIPGSNTSSIRGRKAMNDVVNGDRIERRRWCSRLRVNLPRRGEKERERVGADWLVKFLSYTDSNLQQKPNFNPSQTMTLTRAFFARPRGGRHSHAPGCAPDIAGLSIDGMRMWWWRRSSANGGALHAVLRIDS